jgi:predicted aldo/keto reductase-like oxidoreductase
MVLQERILGKTGLKVKFIGFGGIPIQRVSEEEAVRVVKRCYDLGINYFDTARGYTTSEERIGKALEDVRDKVYLATKSHARLRIDIERDMATSLRNLRTDYIDVYQLHNIASLDAWNAVKAPGGALEAVLDAKNQGKIKHIGITSHNPGVLAKILEEGFFETAMIPYNYLATEPEKEVLPVCEKMDVGVIIMKPFGGGAFYNSNTALKFVLANQVADITIPGMLSVAEVEENIDVCQGDLNLTLDEIQMIEDEKKRLGDQYCRFCDYCQPCPVGIPISFVLRAEVSVLRRMGWQEGTVKQVDEAADKVAQCLHCGACETRCPYELPIRALLPEKMDRLRKLKATKTIPV